MNDTEDPAAPTVSLNSAPPKESAAAQPPLVMVVDDDNDTRGIIRQAMLAVGYRVQEAADGLAAKDECQRNLPDLIVLDLMMPRMTGMEFVQWFREAITVPFVPVLMLTALSDIEQKVQGLTMGADDYLPKPFHYRELQARVQALLRIRSLTNDLYRRQDELEALNVRLSEMQAELVRRERELAVGQTAGAAAHSMGQPVTTILLHCRILARALESALPLDPGLHAKLTEGGESVRAIQKECQELRALLAKLQAANADSVTAYVGEKTIIDIGKSGA